MASQEKYTILYGRLSQEDMQKKSGAEDDSNSIQNQRLLLEKYAKDKGFTNVKFIYDDGYSGTNFRRPGWEELMELVESEQVATIIVKDMSRLGREYLQVGQYTEIVFPNHGIRFIAVNDGVDSLCESTNDFTPFRNVINELYAKDNSRKIRSAARVKAETGARVGSRPPYGYQKDPADPKRHIIPDPVTAPMAQHIFALCAAGSGPSQIARQLESEKVLTPACYYYRKYGVATTGLNLDEPYKWNGPAVSSILENEVYLGHTVNLRYTTVSFKNKRRIERPESEQLRFEHTHDALIDETTWNIVRDIRAHKRRRTNMDEQDMFSGLVYCLDCGSTMTLSRAHTMKESQYNFTCQNHRKNGKNVCSPHYIRESIIATIVLDDIRRITHLARQNEVAFAQHIGMKRTKEARKEINALQKRIDADSKRDAELTTMFKRIYEDSALGRLPDEQYRVLSEGYLAEQKQIHEELPKLQARVQELKESVANVARFIDMAKKYDHIDELTPEILRTFVRRIEVGERDKKNSRVAPRDIKIYYREIGLADDIPQSMAEDAADSKQDIA